MANTATLVAALALITARSADAFVACNTGFIEFTCPDTHPQCCTWPNNGVVAACCPAAARCGLDEGICILAPNSSGTTPGSNGTDLPNEQGGVTVGVSEAAAFITFAAIGFIVALVGCAFLGFRIFIFNERRRAARQEAERQALIRGSDTEDDGSDDDDSDDNGADGADSVVDDEGQCNICYAHHVNCALMPCAHVATCRACAARLDKCPICREEVTRFVAFKARLFNPPAARGNAAEASPTGPAASARGAGRSKQSDARTEELGDREARRSPDGDVSSAQNTGRRSARRVAAVINGDDDDVAATSNGTGEAPPASPAVVVRDDEPVAATTMFDDDTADADQREAGSVPQHEAAAGADDSPEGSSSLSAAEVPIPESPTTPVTS